MQRVWFRVRTQFHYRVSHTHSTHNATQRILTSVQDPWPRSGCFRECGTTQWEASCWPGSATVASAVPASRRGHHHRVSDGGPVPAAAVGAQGPAAAVGQAQALGAPSGPGRRPQQMVLALITSHTIRRVASRNNASKIPRPSASEVDIVRGKATAMLQEFRRTVVGMIAAAVRQWGAYAILVLPSTARQPIISSERCSLLPCAAALKNKKTNSNSMLTAIIFPAGVFDAVASPCAYPLARSQHDFPKQSSTGNS